MFLDKVNYTAEDVRYTTKGNNIYAIFLGWPGSGKFTLSSFSKEVLGEEVPEIKSVSILGVNENIDYKLKEQGLEVILPSEEISEKALVVQILTKK